MYKMQNFSVTQILFEINFSEEMNDRKKALNSTVKNVPFCRNTVVNILKEKKTHGDVIDGNTPKTRLRRFDKLSLEQKEDIRKLVQCPKSEESFSKCHNFNSDHHCTVWKFHNFSITQILREIYLRDSGSAKTAVF